MDTSTDIGWDEDAAVAIEWDDEAAEEQPADQELDSELKEILEILETKAAKIKATFREERATNGKPVELDQEGQTREEAQVFQRVLLELDNTHHNIGKAALAAMWKLHATKLFLYVNESQSLEDMILNMRDSFHDFDYMVALARGTQVILQYAWEREASGKPVLIDPQNGSGKENQITVNSIIAGNGYVTKIKQFHDHFSKITEPEAKEEFLRKLVTQSRSEILKAVKEDQEKDEIGVAISAVEKVDPKTQKHTLILSDLDEVQYQLVKRLLRKVVTIHQE